MAHNATGFNEPKPITKNEATSNLAEECNGERLQLAERLLSFGSWEWHVATGVVTWSAGMEQIYGLKPGTFGGTCDDFSRRVHPDDLAELERVRCEAVQRGTEILHTYRIVPGDKRVRWVQCRAEAIRDAQGNVERIAGITLDVTEQKIAEQALATHRARLATVLKLSDIAVFHQDRQLRYTWIENPKLGTCQQEMIGHTDMDLLGKQGSKPLTDIKRRVLRTQHGERQEVWLERDTHRGCFDLIVEPEYDANGRMTGVVCAATDITTREEAKSRLALQAELLKNLPAAVNMVDQQGILRYTNVSFDTLFGYEPGELLGQHAAVLNAQAGAEEAAAEIMRALLGEGQWSGEVLNRRKDGSLFWSHAKIVAAKHPDYGVIWITSQWDVTDLHNARIDRDRAFSVLSTLSDHLQDQREQQRLDLAREVHDEIGATLTGIRMRVDALQKRLDVGTLHAISNDLSRALEATRGLCSRLRPPMLDDLGLIETLRWYCQDWSKKTGIRIRTRIGAGVQNPEDPLRIDLFRMTQEILTNIARHAGATVVSLSLRQTDRRLTLRVHDNGRGFASDTTEGFGLIGIRERLRRHQGYLVIETSEQGATLTLSVPQSARGNGRGRSLSS